jgi:hypothetical protein
MIQSFSAALRLVVFHHKLSSSLHPCPLDLLDLAPARSSMRSAQLLAKFLLGYLLLAYLLVISYNSNIRLHVPEPASYVNCYNPQSSDKNTSKLKRNQVKLQVLPERLIAVFGLESSGTTFLAETLATAIAARRIRKK